MVEEIIAMKRRGMANSDIIAAIGVHESTFYRWLARSRGKMQRELCEQYKKGETEYKAELLEAVRTASAARNKDWTAAAWLLERKYPEEYSRRRIEAKAMAADAPTLVPDLGPEPAASSEESSLA